MALTPRQVYGGAPYRDDHAPRKTDIIPLWEDTLNRIDALEDNQANGTIGYRTWSELSVVTGESDGFLGRVTDDAGTHTDPVVGGTVANEGLYRWSTSPVGWERIGDDLSQEIADHRFGNRVILLDKSSSIYVDRTSNKIFIPAFGIQYAPNSWLNVLPVSPNYVFELTLSTGFSEADRLVYYYDRTDGQVKSAAVSSVPEPSDDIIYLLGTYNGAVSNPNGLPIIDDWRRPSTGSGSLSVVALDRTRIALPVPDLNFDRLAYAPVAAADVQYQSVMPQSQVNLSGLTGRLDLTHMIAGTMLTVVGPGSVYAGDSAVFQMSGGANLLTLESGEAARIESVAGALHVFASNGSTLAYSTITAPIHDYSVVCGGQSHARYFIARGGVGGLMRGLRDSTWLSAALDLDINFIDGATGGSAIDRRSSDTNYWWDAGAGTPGPALTNFLAQVGSAVSGGQPQPSACLWMQGEADTAAVQSGAISIDELAATIDAVFSHIQSQVDFPPEFRFIITQIGTSRISTQQRIAASGVRIAYQSVIDSRPDTVLGPEVYDLPQEVDDIHLNGKGCFLWGYRMARCVANEIFGQANSLGPTISSVANAGGSLLNIAIVSRSGSPTSAPGNLGRNIDDGPYPWGHMAIDENDEMVPALYGYRDTLGRPLLVFKRPVAGLRIVFPAGYFPEVAEGRYDKDSQGHFGVSGLPIRSTITAPIA